MNLIYKDSDPKYSIPVIGFESDIANLTRDNLIQFHKKYIEGEKILSIIGSVEEDKILDLITKTFKTKPIKWKPKFIKSNSKLVIPFINNKFNFSQQIKIIISPEIKQTLVFIGFKSIGLYSKWNYVTDIVENILTGGMTSRLFVLLRNKLGLTYYQNSFNKTFTPHGFFCINYGVQPSGLKISVKHVLEEILGLAKSEITDEEISKAKNTLETSILFNLETATNIGSNIVNYVVSKLNPEEIKKLHKKINAVTKNHVKQFAKKVFTKSNMYIVINGKESESFLNELLI